MFDNFTPKCKIIYQDKFTYWCSTFWTQSGTFLTVPYSSVVRHLKAVKILIFEYSFPISQLRSSLPTSFLDCQNTLSMGRTCPYLPEKLDSMNKEIPL